MGSDVGNIGLDRMVLGLVEALLCLTLLVLALEIVPDDALLELLLAVLAPLVPVVLDQEDHTLVDNVLAARVRARHSRSHCRDLSGFPLCSLSVGDRGEWAEPAREELWD